MPAVRCAPVPGPREWTTADARPVERLDYWVGAICEAFLEMDCHSRAAECFDGTLTHLPLQQLALNQVCASTQEVYRTPANIARSSAQPFYLIAQTEQPWQVKQGGQRLQLRPGDVVLVDAAQPYELHFPNSVNCLSMQMPRSWVGQWLRTIDTPVARVAHREQGWGPMLSALCMQLGRQPGLALQTAPDWLEGHFGALLSAALEPAAPQPPLRSCRALHQRAVSIMRERLDQPGWSATDLASDLGVSLRTLQRAFTEVGETVAGSWRAMRIGHACALLSQPRLAGLAMSEIGRRCGYADASHFTRDFQRCMGKTPLRWARERSQGCR
jgi:AraC family transcriptional regulator, positive regulator of tynA and feaB